MMMLLDESCSSNVSPALVRYQETGIFIVFNTHAFYLEKTFKNEFVQVAWKLLSCVNECGK